MNLAAMQANYEDRAEWEENEAMNDADDRQQRIRRRIQRNTAPEPGADPRRGGGAGRRPAVKTVISTPRQKIKVVVGLRNDPSWGRLIEDDSTLMGMDAPEVIPAGSSRPAYPSDEILRGYTRETVVFREVWK